MLEEIKNNMNKDYLYGENACKNKEGYRLKEEPSDIRPCFSRDADRIIYSLSYSRYLDKTQVFSMLHNDHISKRITHVNMVSKIARTIGRALNLNEDLIEAASLGHDLGHVPFGHVGEKILSDISIKNNEGYFNHNIQSVRNLMFLENNCKGCNITVQVLDAIMCHNGEFINRKLIPRKKTQEEFLEEYKKSYKEKDICKTFRPMTLEGCVVRISDVIGYIGRDIEDAIRIGMIKENEIPKEITDVLGKDNRTIVNTLVMDIINNSFNKNCIEMSKEVSNALIKLKDFNYENIYKKANTKEQIKEYEKMFNELFNYYKNDIETNKNKSSIYKIFLKYAETDYIKNNSKSRIVIDYISGMTDDFFIKEYKSIQK